MSSGIYALPDGRHVAVGPHASLAALNTAGAPMDQFDYAVTLEASTLGDHHARIEQELREARTLISALRAEIARRGDIITEPGSSRATTSERLAEINALAKGDPWVIGPELVKVVNEQEAEIAAGRALLHRLVDHEDIGCMLDHHGYCQEHGLSAAPCAVAEARRHLAGTTQTITTVTKETVSE